MKNTVKVKTNLLECRKLWYWRSREII